MQIKKVAQKIAAISTGALMLGATLTGALAASTYSLANYPAPFVKNGVLDNTVIVVGKTAQTSDVLGAIDIAAALQAAAVSKEVVASASAVAPTIDKGVLVDKTGTHFNYGSSIYTVKPEPVDKNDLPDLFSKATFKDTKGANKADKDYEQLLQFESGAFEFLLTQPTDMDGGSYLQLNNNDRVYNYSVTFNTGVAFSTSAVSADFEGDTIKLQGNTYTITEANVDSTYKLSKLKLVAGDSTVWLQQDQPYTVGSHTVTVVDVDTGSTKCGINVDGATKWVDVSSTETFGDLSVGVLSAVAVNNKDYNADQCELSLGSNELVLEDGSSVSVNNVELQGSTVSFTGTTGSWTGFVVRYTAGNEDSGVNSDDINMKPGEAWTDPVFGNFKVMYDGVTRTDETMKYKVSGRDLTFTYTNVDGQEVVIPWHADTTGFIYLGASESSPMLLPGQITTTSQATTTAGVKSISSTPQRVQFLYTTSGGETHILEMSSLTCGGTTNKTTIKDVTYNTYVAKDVVLVGDCTNVVETVSLGSLGSISLNLTSTSVRFNAGYGDSTPKTKYEGTLTFSNVTGKFFEKADLVTATNVTTTLTYSTSDSRIQLSAPTVGTTVGPVDLSETDSDTEWYRTAKGTLMKYDAKDSLKLDITAPEKDAYANVFVAPLSATVIGGGTTGGVTADKVNPFSVGLAVLDENAASMTKNMIIVGGPCVNDVALDVMGAKKETCADGFEAKKAMIKFFDRSGKAALLVAGFEAEDTLGAAYVLAQHGNYKLEGDEVQVLVTSLDQITVTKV